MFITLLVIFRNICAFRESECVIKIRLENLIRNAVSSVLVTSQLTTDGMLMINFMITLETEYTDLGQKVTYCHAEF